MFSVVDFENFFDVYCILMERLHCNESLSDIRWYCINFLMNFKYDIVTASGRLVDRAGGSRASRESVGAGAVVCFG